MSKEFTLKQLFSIIDGRLSTKMDDVYSILNTFSGESLTTIALPAICDKVKQVKPKWYLEAKEDLDDVKSLHGNDFNTLMKVLEMSSTKYKVTEFLN